MRTDAPGFSAVPHGFQAFLIPSRGFVQQQIGQLEGMLDANAPRAELDVVYHENGTYLPDALSEFDFLLRNFRSGEVAPMDSVMLDFLHAAQQRLGSNGTYEIIAAYRSTDTTEMLRRRGGGVAKRSLHLQGEAIDVRLTDADTRDLRRAARELARGGVGYYAKSDFVHLDTSRVRWW